MKKQILSYADGTLSQDDAWAVREHLRSCQSCQSVLSAISITGSALAEPQVLPAVEGLAGRLAEASARRRQRARSRRRLALMVIPLALVATVLALVLPDGLAEPIDFSAAALADRALSTIEEIAGDLTPGRLLYMKVQEYRRQRPSGAGIEIPGGGTAPIGSQYPQLPESNTQEGWWLVDEDGYIVLAYMLIIDAEGEVFSESRRVDGNFITTFAAGGKQHILDGQQPIKVEAFILSKLEWPQRLKDEEWEFVGSGQLDQRETLIYEQVKPWSPVMSGDEVDIALPGDSPDVDLENARVVVVSPWTLDLDPGNSESRVEAVADNPMLSTFRWSLVGEDGTRTLLMEHTTVAIDVLDGEALPAPLFDVGDVEVVPRWPAPLTP